ERPQNGSERAPSSAGGVKKLLAEEIELGLDHELSSVSVTRKAQAANEDNGDPLVLAARQIGRGGDLVGDGDAARAELVAHPVRRPPEVDDWRDSGDADGDVGGSLPERPPERVGDDEP